MHGALLLFPANALDVALTLRGIERVVDRPVQRLFEVEVPCVRACSQRSGDLQRVDILRALGR
jgi:hypothetical protein